MNLARGGAPASREGDGSRKSTTKQTHRPKKFIASSGGELSVDRLRLLHGAPMVVGVKSRFAADTGAYNLEHVRIPVSAAHR